jgi:ubiquinone/menaquinone biosynthesis C-methylase UbiE
MATFDNIAARYRDSSLVQASAGAKLLELLDIPAAADILDVGCGTGNLTASLAEQTDGAVIGIDPSEAMIHEASTAFPDPRITFTVLDAERMNFDRQFDIVYCNSAFQWFNDPSLFLANAFRALRPGGRIGMQAPATKAYCPTFISAVDACCADPAIRQVFDGFRSPWLLLESGEAYRQLFVDTGFRVLFCTLEESRSRRTPEEAFDIFCSGAKAGYLDPGCYDRPWPGGFEAAILGGIRRSFDEMAGTDGTIDLMFHRVFVVAER